MSLFGGADEFITACSRDSFDERACKQAMYTYLQSLAALNAMWRRGQRFATLAKLPFRLRPKAHACHHVVEDKVPVFGNPTLYWGYRDEDFVGDVKHIAGRSVHPYTIEKRCIQKLRILAALEE
jgi:hypothetical protein